MRDDLKAMVANSGLKAGVTGAGRRTASTRRRRPSNAEAIVGIATILLILVLLLIIFRSVILAVLPILVIGARLPGRHRPDRARQQGLRPQGRQLDPGDPDRGAVRHRHRLHPVLPVPLPRAAARAARTRRPRWSSAVERAGEAIASAGGAVIVAFMALVLSSLGIFKSIGPALAIAVARHPASPR